MTLLNPYVLNIYYQFIKLVFKVNFNKLFEFINKLYMSFNLKAKPFVSIHYTILVHKKLIDIYKKLKILI